MIATGHILITEKASRKKESKIKKLIALIMAALLALSAVAFAETYHTGDVVFDYDTKGNHLRKHVEEYFCKTQGS